MISIVWGLDVFVGCSLESRIIRYSICTNKRTSIFKPLRLQSSTVKGPRVESLSLLWYCLRYGIWKTYSRVAGNSWLCSFVCVEEGPPAL